MKLMKNEKVPIILIIYNRSDKAAKVLSAISIYEPTQLFVVADGPKDSRDRILCDRTRSIIDNIDWDCEIFRNYADENLGCGVRPYTGITWAFESCDRAIILEDDCLPDPTFFQYCEELLYHYEEKEDVAMISGTNFLDSSDIETSYYFSKFLHIWGWATWRRVWKNYDFNISNWPDIKKSDLFLKRYGSRFYAQRIIRNLDRIYEGRLDVWDYQFGLMALSFQQLGITPKVNLISNIGFGENATHTTTANNKFADLPLEKMAFPLIHPNVIKPNKIKDQAEMVWKYGVEPSCIDKFYNKLKILAKKAKRFL